MGTSSSGQQQNPLQGLFNQANTFSGSPTTNPLGGLSNYLSQPSPTQSLQMPSSATYQPSTSQGSGSTGPAAGAGQSSPGGSYTPTNPLWTSTNIPGGLGGPNTGQTTGGLPASLQGLLGKAQPAAAQPSKF